MSGSTLALFAITVLATTFLAGLFGMAGGVLLMGALLFLVPVADAMVLHGITMIVANGWRGVLWWRYILWGVLTRYLLGLVLAGAMFTGLMIVPDERVIFLMLGVMAYLGLILPERLVPQADRPFGAELCGFLCTGCSCCRASPARCSTSFSCARRWTGAPWWRPNRPAS